MPSLNPHLPMSPTTPTTKTQPIVPQTHQTTQDNPQVEPVLESPPETQDQDDVQQRDKSVPFSQPDISFEGRPQTLSSPTAPTPIPRVDSVAPRGQDIDIEKTMKRLRRSVQRDLAKFQISGMEYPTSLEQSDAVDFAIADRGLSMSDTDDVHRAVHQAVLADTILTEQGGDGYTSLSSEQKGTVLKMLMLSDFRDLFTPEIQGAGGNAGGAGTTSGRLGHYVNSEMASVVQLAQDNKLTPEFLDALSQLSTGELEPQLAAERTDLISSTLQNVAFPERISQHSKGTCAATVPEIMLATKEPAQYVSLVAQLASPSGEVLLPTGTELSREAGTESLDNSGRSIASRLIQPAFMEYANGARTYDNAPEQGEHSDGAVGLPQTEASDLINGLFGEGSIEKTVSLGGWSGSDKVTPEVLLDTLTSQVEQGHPTPVGIRWGESNHELLVTQMDDDFAYVMNPHGALQKMPRDEFDDRLKMASIPSDDFEMALSETVEAKENYGLMEPAKYMTDEEGLRKDTLDMAQRLEPFEPELLEEIKSVIDTLDGDSLTDLMGAIIPLASNHEFGMFDNDTQLDTLKEKIRSLLS